MYAGEILVLIMHLWFALIISMIVAFCITITHHWYSERQNC